MSICLPSIAIQWYCAFWLKWATQDHSIDCSHSVRVGLSNMMVKRGRGKEGWWQSWHGEIDTHSTLRKRKRRRAAPLHHIPLSKHRRGEREESQDVKKKKQSRGRPQQTSLFFFFILFLLLLESLCGSTDELHTAPPAACCALCSVRESVDRPRGGGGGEVPLAASSRLMDPSPAGLTCVWGLRLCRKVLFCF